MDAVDDDDAGELDADIPNTRLCLGGTPQTLPAHERRRAQQHHIMMTTRRLMLLLLLTATASSSVAFFSPVTTAWHINHRSVGIAAAPQPRHHHFGTNDNVLTLLYSSNTDECKAAAASTMAAALLFALPLTSATAAVAPTPVTALAPSSLASSKTADDTATAIDIKLRNIPSLTRRAIVNREKLSSYLVESLSSIQPIIDILSSKDDDNIVTITPPTNVKRAIDLLLTKGDATFIVNSKDIVDVRVESVPGVLILRVTNPKLPKIPYFPDATGALQFVEDISTAADTASTSPAVTAVSKFLTWGAPITTNNEVPIQFTSLSEDELKVGLGVGMVTIGSSYGISYAYYTKQQQEAENEMNEKRAKMSAATATAAATKKNLAMVQKTDNNDDDRRSDRSSSTAMSMKVQNEGTTDNTITKALPVVDTAVETTTTTTTISTVDKAEKTIVETTNNSSNDDNNANDDTTTSPSRKRDALKKLFRRKK
jgi:hypothetical protein